MTTTNRDNKGRFVKGHKQFNTGRTWLTSERMKGHKFNSGRELSEEHRKSISEAHKGKHKGKNNCGWKGGISFNPYGDGISSFLKNKIRRRDNQICMNCGIHREKLNRALDVHHINYDKKCHMEQNLIALCRSCHNFTKNNKEYWEKLFQEKLLKEYTEAFDVYRTISAKANSMQEETR